jgi:hypothetical protein
MQILEVVVHCLASETDIYWSNITLIWLKILNPLRRVNVLSRSRRNVVFKYTAVCLRNTHYTGQCPLSEEYLIYIVLWELVLLLSSCD